MPTKLSPNDPCPCDSGKKFKKCCRPYHDNKADPPTPEALARARFAAYALSHVDFIMDTTHPDGTSFKQNAYRWRVELEAYTLRTMFQSFELLSAEADTVSYRVRAIGLGYELQQYVEEAVFKQVDGKWLYFDGEIQHETLSDDDEDADHAVLDTGAIQVDESDESQGV